VNDDINKAKACFNKPAHHRLTICIHEVIYHRKKYYEQFTQRTVIWSAIKYDLQLHKIDKQRSRNKLKKYKSNKVQ